ncbi:hypothetical protein ACFSC4_00990 [Deinococcus malanensis]|uniref:hypothetical protein n=1 Tax=Deinococcus malanensis TaxID=1706855 RepID=UPI0036453048
MRSPLPRAVLTRLETGRLVVLSVLLGTLVGGLCILLRLALDAATPWWPCSPDTLRPELLERAAC